MIAILLLLSGIALSWLGLYLMLAIDEAKTLANCYFSVLGGYTFLGVGALLIIEALITL